MIMLIERMPYNISSFFSFRPDQEFPTLSPTKSSRGHVSNAKKEPRSQKETVLNFDSF